MSLLVRQAKVIDTSSPHNGSTVDILVENGRIRDIAPKLEVEEKNFRKEDIIKSGKGGDQLFVSSGWVDLFADYREPGFEQKETIATGLAAAAKGGFTDVMVLPNTIPVSDGRAGIQYTLQQSRGHAVSVHPIGAVSQGIEGKSLAEMMDMRQHGAAVFSDGWKPVQNGGLLLKALEYVKAFDGVIIQLPMDAALSAGGLMHEGAMSTRLGMPGIPSLAESIMVHRDIELARYAGSRLHITGISTAESVNLVWMAKNEGVDVTCSVTPYHLMLTDADMQSYDSAFKVSPPLRTETDREALIAAVADGTIDCIASHHRPQDWDSKAKEFEYAGEGMAVQEIAFALARTAVGDMVSLERLIDAVSTMPRKIFGLAETSINKDAEAHYTIFSPDASFTFDEKSAASLARNNPFGGKTLKGAVHRIVTHIA